MKRREFIQRLGAGFAAAAVATPVSLLTAAPRVASGEILVMNPLWINAPYEVMYAVAKDVRAIIYPRGGNLRNESMQHRVDRLGLKLDKTYRILKEHIPERFDENFKLIPPIVSLNSISNRT